MRTDGQYNEEDVCYCADCLSLRIVGSEDASFCDECGSMDILKTSITEWEEKYKSKYNVSYLNSKRNGREQTKKRRF